jgi:hypothetical protein
MTSRATSTVLLLLLAVSAFASDKPSPQELLDAAHKASDISALAPYILTGTVVVNPGTKQELTGSLAVYRDQDRARVDVQVSGRNETRITIGNKDYVDPDQILFSGTWLNEFDRLWDPVQPRLVVDSGDKWGNANKGKVGNAAVWCIEKGHDGTMRLCFNAERNVVLTSSAAEFSDFTTAGGALFPQTIKINDRHGAPIEVRNIKIVSYPAEPSLFEIPPHAMELETCTDHEPAKLFDWPMPARSNLSRHATNSTVALFAFVNKEGQVSSVKILTLVQADFNARILEAIKKWRFKPATCGGRPVNSALTLEADGHLF